MSDLEFGISDFWVHGSEFEVRGSMFEVLNFSFLTSAF